jgi:hypothetical protein
MANTISASSQPKALTILSRTKHLRQTAMKENPKKIVVTMKIDKLRPSKGSIVVAGIKDCINRDSSSTQSSIAEASELPLKNANQELFTRRKEGEEKRRRIKSPAKHCHPAAISGEKGVWSPSKRVVTALASFSVPSLWS